MIRTDKQVASLPHITFHLELVRYALSGGLATTFHWSIMVLMVIVWSPPVFATAVGALMGAILNYILQRKVTFQSTVTHRFSLPRYCGVCVLTWLMNLLLFVIFHHMFQISPIESQGLTTFVVAFMSYFLYKKVVFNDH